MKPHVRQFADEMYNPIKAYKRVRAGCQDLTVTIMRPNEM